MANVIDFWQFVSRPSFGPSFSELSTEEKISINWFVPPIGPNSGGHINIFRFIKGLEARGFDCRVVIVNDAILHPAEESLTTLARNINEWYGEFSGTVHYLENDLPSAHFTVATGWQTAYAAKQFRGSPMKCYFVQDFEPLFYAMGSEAIFAEQTYRFGFVGFTAGSWLANKLASEYRMRTYPLGFSYNRDLYYPRPRRDDAAKNVFCYVRPETPRRGWEIAALALNEVHRKRPDAGILLLGGSVDAGSLPFPAFAPGSVRQEELPDVYSQCDCALVISLSNLSLLPLELMACGVPVVSNTGPNVEWLLNREIAKLCPPEPAALARSMIEILDMSIAEHNAFSDQVIRFAERTSWDRHIDSMAKILFDMCQPLSPKQSSPIIRRPDSETTARTSLPSQAGG
jgi:O-antigen biosynthesis protein